jgi:hypothetical protein
MARAKLILSRHSGMYVFQAIGDQGNISHAVGIDCKSRNIYDGAEHFVIKGLGMKMWVEYVE